MRLRRQRPGRRPCRGRRSAPPATATTYGGTPTDAAGRTTFTGLIPGATYRLLTTERDNISIDSEVLKDFQVKPGETLELPAFTIKGN